MKVIKTNDHDKRLKWGIRGARLLFRTLDLGCTFATFVSIAVMLHFLKDHVNDTYNYTDSNGITSTIRLFPDPINLKASYLLLAVTCVSFTLSLFVVLSYFRSSKASGKLSTIYFVVEFLLAIIFSFLCYYSASLFQAPKSLKLARHDLWAASCSPLRAPKPNAPPIPPQLQSVLYSMCVGGDWSVFCGFISGCLQTLIVITLILSISRFSLRRLDKEPEATEEEVKEVV